MKSNRTPQKVFTEQRNSYNSWYASFLQNPHSYPQKYDWFGNNVRQGNEDDVIRPMEMPHTK